MGERRVFSTNGAETFPNAYPHIYTNSKWINLNVTAKIINLSKKTGVNQHDLILGNGFLDTKNTSNQRKNR